jgi:hypothetical protein
MTSFSAQTLAVDWQIAPKTPVMTAVGGIAGSDVSVTFDSYGDTQADRGRQISGAYINIPPVFPNTHLVTTMGEFTTAIAAAQEGDAIIIEDGVHDWSNGGSDPNPQYTVQLTNDNGTLENPIYLLAQTPGGVTFTAGGGSRFKMQFNSSHWIAAGINFDCLNQLASVGFYNVQPGLSWIRIHYSEFRQPGGVGPGQRHILVKESSNFEIDNCWCDGGVITQGGIGILVDSPTPSTYFRIHHNELSKTTVADQSGGGSGEAIVAGQGGGILEGFYIIENNIIDNWNQDDELISLKDGMGIVRNNNQIHGYGAAWTVRGGHNVLHHGNWADETRSGVSTQEMGYMGFNYFAIGLQGGAGTSSFPAVRCQSKTTNHDGTIDGTFKNNVFSYFGRLIEARSVADPVLADPTGNLVDGNLCLDPRLQQDDLSPNTNYVDSRTPPFTEDDWRAVNTWGSNIYGTVAPPRSYVVDPALFSGPGTDWIAGVDFVATEVYGQPSQIKMPSWWA